MYQRIIVPLDGSAFAERALEPAVQIGRELEVPLRLLMVASPADAEPYLARLAATLPSDAGQTVLDEWHPASAITRFVSETPDSLVCMATNGRGRLTRAALGSVAEEVIRSQSSPVVLVGRSYRELPPVAGGHLLVCLDGSQRAEAVLPTAAQWAAALRMKVHLLTVARDRETDDAGLANLAARLTSQGLAVDSEIVAARHPAPAIVDCAEDVAASLIAMTTHGRTGLERVALGSVAMEVSRLSPIPLLLKRSVPSGTLAGHSP